VIGPGLRSKPGFADTRQASRNIAVWTYESPYAAVAVIKDHLAFYPDRVDAIEERPGA
jgi:uncharacterized protein (DUF427 family)